ncbi:MAG TPA: hypothetical protein VHD36_00435 [Pirellulales bacterium]|nr:hypothetical protein [Pirellulales bacterium]
MATQTMFHRFHMAGSNTRWQRDTLIFVGGAETLHTLSHLWLAFSGMLPMTFPLTAASAITLTPGLNVFATIVNAVIAGVCLYGAHRLKRHDSFVT